MYQIGFTTAAKLGVPILGSDPRFPFSQVSIFKNVFLYLTRRPLLAFEFVEGL